MLRQLAGNRTDLAQMRQRGMAFAREHLTWDAKARVVTDVLLWATGHGPKPALEPPVAERATVGVL